MGFFELFFSSPGWGWKLLGLIVFIQVFFNGIVSLIKTFHNSKTNLEEVSEVIDKLIKDDKNKSEDQGATKDDVRS